MITTNSRTRMPTRELWARDVYKKIPLCIAEPIDTAIAACDGTKTTVAMRKPCSVGQAASRTVSDRTCCSHFRSCILRVAFSVNGCQNTQIAGRIIDIADLAAATEQQPCASRNLNSATNTSDYLFLLNNAVPSRQPGKPTLTCFTRFSSRSGRLRGYCC